jgi:hypothetical protein
VRGASGFAATDAIVGMAIISSLILTGLTSARVSSALARKAGQAQRNAVVLGFLLDTAPDVVGQTDGRFGATRWRLSIRPVDSPVRFPKTQLCEKRAEVIPDHGVPTARLTLTTLRLCPKAAANG